MRTAFIETLCELSEQDDRIWLLTGDLGYSVLERYASRFPERYVNVGVAEQNMVGVAAGLALAGKIVFIYSIANFPVMRCLEQIRNDVCYHNLNVKIVAVGGGVAYGAQGYTHHGVEDFAVMRALPNMTVLAPGDPIETRLATEAIVDWQGPGYLRLGKAGEPVVHPAVPEFQIGNAIVVRDGIDVTLIAAGGALKATVDAAELLAAQGIQARVLSMCSIKPLDTRRVLQAARETGKLVVIEEHSSVGGLGSAIADTLAQAQVAPAWRHIALTDGYWKAVGSQAHIQKRFGISSDYIRDVVLSMQ
jgi:transketolase